MYGVGINVFRMCVWFFTQWLGGGGILFFHTHLSKPFREAYFSEFRGVTSFSPYLHGLMSLSVFSCTFREKDVA
jgi:hypothetical protein